VRRRLALLVVLALAGACGGTGDSKDGGEKRFLLVMHTALAGSISSKPDAELLELGHRACAGLDSGQRSDEVVSSLSGDALPGSAEFNGYAYLVASAATELCPSHKSQFQGTVPGSP